MKRIMRKVYTVINMIWVKVVNIFIISLLKAPTVKSIDESIIKIINDKCSVSRFGDGEMWIVSGGSIKYQKFNKELQSRLKEILKSNIDNHMVTLPDVFEEKKLQLRTYENQQFWNENLKSNRIEWYKNIDRKKVYYNTAISRFYMPIKDKKKSDTYVKLLKDIWEGKDVLIVEGEKSRLGVGNDLFNNCKSITRVLCPSEQAYEKYEEILKESRKYGDNKLVLIALGPTATVLAFDLAKLGVWAIDIGHIDIEYEWYKLKVNSPVKINNKYTNEAKNGREVEDVYDKNYENQIVCRIS